MADPEREVIVLGDFNLHHPLWSTIHNPPSYRITQSRDLLSMIEEFHLHLLTVPGTITHRWNGGTSTIDLTFSSDGVASRLVRCQVDAKLDYDSDHLPIATELTWDWQPATPTRKRMWDKSDLELLRGTVIRHLPQYTTLDALKDKASIDGYVDQIVTAL